MSFSTIAKWGISPGFPIVTMSQADRRFSMDHMVTVGAKLCRIDITATGSFTTFDPVVDDAVVRGLDPYLCLYGTTGVRSVDTWGQQTAAHYLGKATFIEVCNEPDLHGWTANGYADFVSGTYDSIKLGNPNAVVIAGALWKGGGLAAANGPKAMVQALITRAAGKFDAISMHLYDWSGAHGASSIWDWAFEWGGVGFCDNGANGGTVRKLLNDNGLSAIPILNGETAVKLGAGTLQDQADGVGDNMDQVLNGKTPLYNHFEMLMADTTNQFALLDASRLPKPNYTKYQSKAKARKQPQAMMF